MFSCFKFCSIFNWRIITVQYCDGFCHTSVWTGHRCTCVPSILNSPSQLTLSLQVMTDLHTSNSHWLTVLHMVMYVSVLFSQIIPPSSSYFNSRLGCTAHLLCDQATVELVTLQVKHQAGRTASQQWKVCWLCWDAPPTSNCYAVF